MKKCPQCGGDIVSTAHGPYCPKPTCKWGWETEMDGSPLLPEPDWFAEAEKFLNEPDHQVGQEPHQFDCGGNITNPRCERCRIIVIMCAFAHKMKERS